MHARLFIFGCFIVAGIAIIGMMGGYVPLIVGLVEWFVATPGTSHMVVLVLGILIGVFLAWEHRTN